MKELLKITNVNNISKNLGINFARTLYPRANAPGIFDGQQLVFDFDRAESLIGVTNTNGNAQITKKEDMPEEKIKRGKIEGQQTYHIFERGITLFLPPQATRNINQTLETGRIPETEGVRLSRISSCKILKERHPMPEDGMVYMSQVDYERRNELLQLARNLTTCIVKEWRKIEPGKPIAVVLFGSVAKGLVRRGNHQDPSNIDLAVIGDFTDKEAEQLKDAIRPRRKEAQEIILRSCPLVISDDKNPGNAGVHIQSIKSLNAGDYSGALNHINAGALAIHDPSGVWDEIEKEALSFVTEKALKKAEKDRIHRSIFRRQRKCIFSRLRL